MVDDIQERLCVLGMVLKLDQEVFVVICQRIQALSYHIEFIISDLAISLIFESLDSPAAMITRVGHCSPDSKNDDKNVTMFILLMALMYLSDASLCQRHVSPFAVCCTFPASP